MNNVETKKAEAEAKAEEEAKKKSRGFTVGNPQELVPQERPLVIVPDGAWKNDAQAQFAKTLNGYAYKNPTKWEIKKPVLLAQLEALGTNPGLFASLRGPVNTNITIKNTLMDKPIV